MLVYRCPKHGKTVRTTIETTENELRRLAAFKLSVWCPHCDDAHVIMGKDATVAPMPLEIRVAA
jgi:hypothetical protein